MIDARQQRGTTLFEIIIVLMLFGSIAIVGFRVYSDYLSQTEFILMKGNIDQILNALNIFYEANCRDGADPQPTIVGLVAGFGILDPNVGSNLFGTDFAPSIDWNTPNFLRISTTIAGADDIARYAGELEADRVVGRTLTWERLPQIFKTDAGLDQIANLRFHRPGACL